MAGFPKVRDAYDLVIVGGGHAGLHAGVKAALLHQTALVLDRGPKYSRSYYAPKMENIPGFPEGISGHKLLDLQIAQLRGRAEFATYVTPALVTSVRRSEGGFDVSFDWLRQSRMTRARAVVLAMGVVDRMPEIDGAIDGVFPWANLGLVNFCLLCDAHEVTGKAVAVLGHDADAARVALDLLHFKPGSVEVLTNGRPFLARSEEAERVELRAALEKGGIGHVATKVVGYDGLRERAFHVRFQDGSVRPFDLGFSGLGWYDMHTALPKGLGCALDAEGFVSVDEDCRALAADGSGPIPGLYVIGDLKSGWNQIPEAWASAERAVTHAYGYYL